MLRDQYRLLSVDQFAIAMTINYLKNIIHGYSVENRVNSLMVKYS